MRFEKVSFEEFERAMRIDCGYMMYNEDIKQIYDKIELPKRATKQSAGYDFYSPLTVNLGEHTSTFSPEYTLIPTGIRFVCEPTDNVFLMCVPRSGFGFKFGMRLRNTAGIIDADYCCAKNSGHIMAKIGSEDKVTLEAGKAFMQGIILPYLTVENDEATDERVGGLGSTTK